MDNLVQVVMHWLNNAHGCSKVKGIQNTENCNGGGIVLVVVDLTLQFLKRRSNNFAWRTKTDGYRLQRHPGDVIWTKTVIKKCQHFSKLTCLSSSSVVETLEYSPDEVEENLPIWKSQIKKNPTAIALHSLKFWLN